MDKVDKKLLQLLQNDGRMSNKDLAETVALSTAPCLRRVKRLEAEGYIEGYQANICADKVGCKLTAFIHITLDKHSLEGFNVFQNEITQYKEVVECHLLSGGEADYIVKLRVKDMAEYNEFILNCLSTIKVIDHVATSFVMESVVNTNKIPL